MSKIHRRIWERHWGQKIPKGYDIHHIDGNHSNNDVDNLLCVTRLEHAYIHKLQGDNGAYNMLVRTIEKPQLPHTSKHKNKMREYQKTGRLKCISTLSDGKGRLGKIGGANSTACVIDGKKYLSMKNAGDELGIDRGTVRYRVNSNNFKNYRYGTD